MQSNQERHPYTAPGIVDHGSVVTRTLGGANDQSADAGGNFTTNGASSMSTSGTP